ncbi:glycosyltransferase family 1 protein [Ramaria rubella]|nr:glycosyltransferase family 1 protein [Ramaria rubella]
MRAGTQTLIQALQAIPWEETDRDDGDGASGSEDERADAEDEGGPVLASSIHTIYRPIARIRRGDTPFISQTPGQDGEYFGYSRGLVEQGQEQEQILEELIEDDFEPDSTAQGSSLKDATLAPPEVKTEESPARRGPMLRAGSMATVRVQRRAKLAFKLQEVFELDDIKEVVAELPCWLLRSVLLQGYLYLTNAHLCFFAHIPAREDQILKSGSLNKKTQRTKRWTKYWFVLKNDVLTWYNSSSDPYFPRGVADLRYAISCEATGEKGFKLRTNDRSITLSADSVPSRDEWVKAIRKVIFKAQNMGESIAIPYSLIVDVEKSSAMDFSETLEVKVIDKGSGYSVDSYFFAYFQDLTQALEQIRELVRSYKHSPTDTKSPEVKDTTSLRVANVEHSVDNTGSSMSASKGSNFKFTSLFKPFSTNDGIEPIIQTDSRDRPTHTSLSSCPPHDDSSSSVSTLPGRPVPLPLVPVDSEPCGKVSSQTKSMPEGIKLLPTHTRNASSDHTYPPSPSPGPFPFKEHQGSWNVSVPSWLRAPGRRVFSSINVLQTSPSSATDRVKEMYSSGPTDSGDTNMGFSIIDAKEAAADPDIVAKFRTSFALDDKEALLGYIPGYLFRALPVSGKFYISTSYLCFRSSQPLTKTRMIIPIRDILTSERSKGYRFGMHGLVVIIKGHEELFFEFSSTSRRDSCAEFLEKQLESLRERLAEHNLSLPHSPSSAKRDALFLEELETNSLIDNEPNFPPEMQTDSLPAVMFTSSSSTFLTFKPRDPLHFTFLTIGSRGDVQPYIALGKRLLQEGHHVRIATHGEFKEWIEAHNIEFAYVGGDPAELMRICVENGMFTVSFLKETAAKFRGWIDDLLKTSWEACQGTDVLIESPSAMGGIHIAEALKIPYFRAFTMPWTRTRAYPHAFGVPDRKMGGGYNYMTYVMFDQVFWRGTSGQINRWRRKVLGLGSTSLDKMDQHKVPFLYNFSPAVVPPPLDWYEWIRVTGYWFLDDAEVGSKKWTPPTDLLEFIETAHTTGKKVVYIGFGSIVVSDPESMTKCVVEAILKSGVHAILSKGWSDRLSLRRTVQVEESEEPLPREIYSISSIPHDWLFDRIDAACHHGGAGTTGASLRAGIPTIIKPFFGDQFFWSDRVEALGIGSSVRKLTVENLTAALLAATTDIKQISRAKIIGQTIRSEDGVGKAVESIYRDLEYARSLIKRVDDFDLDTHSSPSRPSSRTAPTYSYSGSPPRRPASEDWSVISEQDDRHRDSSQSDDGPNYNTYS